MSKYSVGVYSTEPADWAADRSKALQDDIAALPKVAVTRDADGPGTIETYSVRYDWPVRTGVIVGRLDADGSRFMAITEDDDLVALMTDGDPLGAAISVTSDGGINRATGCASAVALRRFGEMWPLLGPAETTLRCEGWGSDHRGELARRGVRRRRRRRVRVCRAGRRASR